MKNIFEKLANYSFDMLAILDINGNFVFANRAFLEEFGWSEQEILGRPLTQFMVFKDPENSPTILINLKKGHPVIFSDALFKHKNQSQSPIHWTAYPEPNVLTIFLILHKAGSPTTDHEIFKMAVEASPTVMFIVKDGRFLYANLLAEKVFGYTQSEFIGNSLELLVPPRLHKTHQTHHNKYIQQPYTRLMGTALELLGVRKDGSEILLDIGLNPVYSLDGLMVICSIIDVTKRKEAENIAAQKIQGLENEIRLALDTLALTDELTSLFNRRALFKYFELHYRIAQKDFAPLSFILADVDGFKEYNDTFGHVAGDEALQLLSTLMLTSFRKTDVVCRYGGDELAVILPATDVRESKIMGERLRKAVGEFQWPHRKITLSIGEVTLLPHQNQTASLGGLNTYIAMADMALYSSKRSGRNKATHYDDMETTPSNKPSDWKVQA